jgi:hypothetical protein
VCVRVCQMTQGPFQFPTDSLADGVAGVDTWTKQPVPNQLAASTLQCTTTHSPYSGSTSFLVQSEGRSDDIAHLASSAATNRPGCTTNDLTMAQVSVDDGGNKTDAGPGDKKGKTRSTFTLHKRSQSQLARHSGQRIHPGTTCDSSSAAEFAAPYTDPCPLASGAQLAPQSKPTQQYRQTGSSALAALALRQVVAVAAVAAVAAAAGRQGPPWPSAPGW